MTDERVQRRHRRYSVALNVEISARDWDDVKVLSTVNVSRGGVFIRSHSTVPVGSLLAINVRLPDGTTLTASGVVVHSIPHEAAQQAGSAAGFGVRFDEQHALDLGLLEAIAASHSGGRSGSYRLDELYTSMPTLVSVPGTTVQLQTSAHQLIERDDDGETREASSESLVGREDPISYEVEIPDAPVEDLVIAPTRTHRAQDEDETEIPIHIDDSEATGPRADELGAPHRPRRQVIVPDDVIFGVDFGTSFSGIAVVTRHEVAMLLDEEGNSVFPSTVCYLEDGKPLVGWEARIKTATHPSTTIASCKRLMGRRYEHASIQPFLAQLAARTHAGPNGQVMVDVYGQAIPVIQIGRDIFRFLANIGTETTSVPVKRIVISAPVEFDDVQRRAIRRSAELANLEVVDCIDEPVAAAMAYGLGRDDGLIAVYDFGGGTFDCTLLEIKKGRFKVRGRAGDAWLGGDDFDAAIANHAADQFWRRTKVDLRNRRVEWRRLLLHAEAAKRRLSVQRSCKLHVRAIVLSLTGAIDLEMELTRDLIDELCRDLVDRTLMSLDECLEGAGVTPQQVDRVVMVGGVARMPLVRKRVQEYFEREVSLVVDPEHAVVLGNAIHARFMSLRKAPAPVVESE
ncbi:MAG: Hsp70 family protein [Myxococcales bacterium]|nr:Hsp70 family protein [Myxococcales bacterium]